MPGDGGCFPSHQRSQGTLYSRPCLCLCVYLGLCRSVGTGAGQQTTCSNNRLHFQLLEAKKKCVSGKEKIKKEVNLIFLCACQMVLFYHCQHSRRVQKSKISLRRDVYSGVFGLLRCLEKVSWTRLRHFLHVFMRT